MGWFRRRRRRGDYEDDGAAGDSAHPSIHCSEMESDHQSEAGGGENHALLPVTSVWRMRLVGFILLMLFTIGLSIGVHHVIRTEEQRRLEDEFWKDSSQLLDSIGQSLGATLGGIDALSVSLLSFAQATNQSWPLVTIPNFSVRAEKNVGRLANSVSLYPYVSDRLQWENYTAIHGYEWVAAESHSLDVLLWDVIWEYDEDQLPQERNRMLKGPFLPSWQTTAPPRQSPVYNWDLLSSAKNKRTVVTTAVDTNKATISSPYYTSPPPSSERNDGIERQEEVVSAVFYPILKGAADTRVLTEPLQHELVALLGASFEWRDLLKMTTSASSNLRVVIDSSTICSNYSFAYELEGDDVAFLGPGSDDASEVFRSVALSELMGTSQSFSTGVPLSQGNECEPTINVYPSTSNAASSLNIAAIATSAIVVVFVVTSGVLLTIDACVERRQRVVLATAVRTNEIVSSLYPENVRERMFSHREKKYNKRMSMSKRKSWTSQFFLGNSFLGNSFGAGLNAVETSAISMSSTPIAEYYPDTTVLFADLAGFTAWSSTREPSQVFILLETIYEEFDRIAKKRRVFKIETIGDCYLAVAGVPRPLRHHAVVMCRFASDCRDAMNRLTPELEPSLGPGTADLLLRVGLHSGSVTGGVLRGEKCLFTLFGDTVNTASRMESNGKPNQIQVSQKTADLLIASGKEDWLTKREDLIVAKGKGKMQTYWVEPVKQSISGSSLEISEVSITTSSSRVSNGSEISLLSRNRSMRSFRSLGDGRSSFLTNKESATSINARRTSKWWGNEKDLLPSTPHGEASNAGSNAKIDGLVDWNVLLLEGLFKKLVAHRLTSGKQVKEEIQWHLYGEGKSIRDEVSEAIPLAPYRNKRLHHLAADDHMRAQVPLEIVHQLSSFVSSIAYSYGINEYHNFERASHVTMSLNKLLSRITSSRRLTSEESHVYSFGVACDPLAHIAIIMASLCHGVEHPGIPDSQIVSGDTTISAPFADNTLHEQNSLDASWDVFMLPMYADLRKFLFTNQAELVRFRQLMANAIMATGQQKQGAAIDDADDSRGLERTQSQFWTSAFEIQESSDSEALNRKATMILDQVIHVSSVCHTMQPWKIYQKWNDCLFKEALEAHNAGRIVSDPTLDWYEGVLRFFDRQIIPLATRIKEHSLFGEYSPEFLDRANENREEWENKGRAIVESLKQAFDEAVAARPGSSSYHIGPSDLVHSILEEGDMESSTLHSYHESSKELSAATSADANTNPSGGRIASSTGFSAAAVAELEDEDFDDDDEPSESSSPQEEVSFHHHLANLDEDAAAIGSGSASPSKGDIDGNESVASFQGTEDPDGPFPAGGTIVEQVGATGLKDRDIIDGASAQKLDPSWPAAASIAGSQSPQHPNLSGVIDDAPHGTVRGGMGSYR